jgi:Arc/MetJ-type ribon-helix-helix transcriptional regulator
MKERVSATVESETRKSIEKLLKSGKYRNMSHVIETAIGVLEEKENEKGQ